MPNTNDAHGESEIIFENEDWLIVEPMDYDSYVYYAPDNMKSKWDDFSDNNLYCIVSKTENSNTGLKTYMMYKDEYGKSTYYNWNGREFSKETFLDVISDDIKPQIIELIGVGKLYELLTKIANGEVVSSRWMENTDELIYDFKYTPKAPIKSKITFRFDEDDYIKLFNPSEEDLWYYNAITGYYDTYEWEDGYQLTEDFNDGYFFSYMGDDNIEKIKQILSIISPSSVELDTDTVKSEAGLKLYEMFENEIENIISDYTMEYNICKTNGFKKMIKDDFCNAFYNDGIFTKHCLIEYFTSAGLLLSLYDMMGDNTSTISELLFKIGSDKGIAGWADNIYEFGCDDFDQESFDSNTSIYLDKIMEKLEDESEYEDIYEYAELYKRLDSKFKINNRYTTKSGREFFYKGINPKNNRILVEVFKKDEVGMENRSYTEEEFENFLVSPDLFESKKRRQVISEQTTGKDAFRFVNDISKVDPTIFNTKKPLEFLQKKLSEYKSKNPKVNLDMKTLVKQLSSPNSPFTFTTFKIQTYEPKRVSTIDVNLKNIGFTLTKNNIDPGTIQGGVKLKF